MKDGWKFGLKYSEISEYFHLGLRRLSALKLTYYAFILFIFVFFYAYLPFYFGPNALLEDSSLIFIGPTVP